MRAFKAPRTSIGALDSEAAATLIAAASDIALILDPDGTIRDVACQSEELAAELEGGDRWVGRHWLDSVTVESRPKIEALLREAGSGSVARWRHVNHPSSGGRADIPILYSTLRIGRELPDQTGKGPRATIGALASRSGLAEGHAEGHAEGRIVAFGRDLRAISALQQRLMDAQQSMERDYSRLRHVETRYRLLFELSSEAVLVLDGAGQKIVEANPAARTLYGEQMTRLLGRAFAEAFDAAGAAAVQSLLASVRAAGRGDDVQARLGDGGREVVVSASLFRQENASLFLVRIVPREAHAAALPKIKAKLLKLVESAPDGFVVTEPDGRIVTANAAFLDMVRAGEEQMVRGESLERWLGRPGVDLSVLIANLRQRGSVRLFATTLRTDHGSPEDVEISAVSVMNGGQPCFGFASRPVGRRLQADSRAGKELPRSVEQLTELIGRVSLKDLVREATYVIERLCIEAALELTGDNRASAAEMLGLSRQSLYVKLRRYGLGDLAADGVE